MATSTSSSTKSLVSTVLLRISCSDLLSLDLLSSSDGLVVVSQCVSVGGTKKLEELGRTEVVQNSPNPVFKSTVTVAYKFEEFQNLRFDVYDADSDGRDLSAHDHIGFVEVSLGSLMGERKGQFTGPLSVSEKHKRSRGNLTVTAEEVVSSKEMLHLTLRGIGLDKKDFFGKSDPFYCISRKNNDGSFSVLYSSEVVKNTLNPTWKEAVIPVGSLCNCDRSRPIHLECFDWDDNTEKDLIGAFDFSLNDILSSPDNQISTPSFALINPKKQKSKGYSNSGRIQVDKARIEVQASFLDYVVNGLQMNMIVAVDFTASNGNPRDPRSLHFIEGPHLNQYQLALHSVGTVLQDYVADKWFPAYGFGAEVPDRPGVTSDIFSLNLQLNSFCVGLQGILDAYANAVRSVTLSGPTNFSPMITAVADTAQYSVETNPGAKYYLLLILTDGVITDMQSTKKAIVRASTLPMSIVIVGVGSADFSAMEELDADKKALSADGKVADRDIVQFVPFRNFVQNGWPVPELLAKAVLAEIPNQVMSYMSKHGYAPGHGKKSTGVPS